jgi:hypothetical protein
LDVHRRRPGREGLLNESDAPPRENTFCCFAKKIIPESKYSTASNCLGRRNFQKLSIQPHIATNENSQNYLVIFLVGIPVLVLLYMYNDASVLSKRINLEFSRATGKKSVE